MALRLKDENPVAAEVGRARAIAYRAALDEIDGDPSEEAEILRLEYRALLLRAERRSRWRGVRRTPRRPAAATRHRRGAPLDPRHCASRKRSATTRSTASKKNSTRAELSAQA